jgi:hypothetical protein
MMARRRRRRRKRELRARGRYEWVRFFEGAGGKESAPEIIGEDSTGAAEALHKMCAPGMRGACGVQKEEEDGLSSAKPARGRIRRS